MIALVTISDMHRLALVVDLHRGGYAAIPVHPDFIDPTIVDRVQCRPFGITWSPQELYIANNRQLLVFDHDLHYLRTDATRLQINVHQLAYQSGLVWAVSPWTNSLIAVDPEHHRGAVEFELSSYAFRPYVEHEAREAGDTLHLNSLLWCDRSLFVAAHAFGPASFITEFDARTMRFARARYDTGSAIHGLARDGGGLFWLSTGTAEIRSDRGLRLPLSRPGYARGFAMTARYFIVAISERLARGRRHAGDSWVQLIDRESGAVVNELCLRGTGSINDLRLLDEYDYGHQLGPFWQDVPSHPAFQFQAIDT